MFCTNCGKELPQTAAFCDNCGTPTGVSAGDAAGGAANFAATQAMPSQAQQGAAGMSPAMPASGYAPAYGAAPAPASDTAPAPRVAAKTGSTAAKVVGTLAAAALAWFVGAYVVAPIYLGRSPLAPLQELLGGNDAQVADGDAATTDDDDDAPSASQGNASSTTSGDATDAEPEATKDAAPASGAATTYADGSVKGYVNSRYGYSMQFPAGTELVSESANGDGAVFYHAQSGVTVTVSGENNVTGTTVASRLQARKDAGTQTGEIYTASGDDWCVWSDKNTYIKDFVGDGCINTIEFSYSDANVDKGSDFIESYVWDFSSGNLSVSH